MSCIEWTGYRNEHGYGRRKYNDKLEYVHRIAYAEAHAQDLSTLVGVVRHKCDNPACVNPAHLELGSVKDNSRDMVLRERQSNRKLTWAIASEIRASYIARHPEYGVRPLARKHKISPGLVSAVLANKVWRVEHE